jgi:excisionase family DNA binding protein
MDTHTAANGSSRQHLAADGSGKRRQILVAGSRRRQAAATYSVAEAAALLSLPERTLREWIRLGKVEALPPRPGERGQRIPAAILEELREMRGESIGESPRWDPAAAGGKWQQTAAVSSERQRQPAAGDESEARIPSTHGVSPDAAGETGNTVSPVLLRAAEEKAALLQAERDRLLEHMGHLRAQLEVRAEELRRRDAAEGELRKLLLVSQQLAHELSQQLEQRALPPAPDPEPARRVRWWHLWRRG